IVYVSMENAYPLGEDLSRLEMFYDMGLRMVGPLHFANNQLGDSSTDSEGTVWEGLSPLGKEMVAEANRLGIILDGSHAHDLVFDDLIELSATPIILSHTGAKAIYDHPRNIDDERLKTLAANGGVIHMNAFGGYLKKLEQDPARGAAMGKLFAELQSAPITTVEERDAFLAKRRAIDAEFPPAMANFEDYMEHFLYVLELIGPDHVGVGADWDGGGGVEGMNDISAFPRITERLLSEGYTEEDLAKIWGGNVKRLLKAAEDYKASLASEEG
ncbi:MAG: membrane dipeptidase, partial [Pseudomonadota bacterium]